VTLVEAQPAMTTANKHNPACPNGFMRDLLSPAAT
jgi:hypothetical protein